MDLLVRLPRAFEFACLIFVRVFFVVRIRIFFPLPTETSKHTPFDLLQNFQSHPLEQNFTMEVLRRLSVTNGVPW